MKGTNVTTQTRNAKEVGPESGLTIRIDAVNPAGNISLLTRHLQGVIKNYLAHPKKECYAEPFVGAPIEMRELGPTQMAHGQAYNVTIRVTKTTNNRTIEVDGEEYKV